MVERHAAVAVMITSLLILSLMVNIVLGIGSARLWMLYWTLYERCDAAGAELRNTLTAMSRLAKRDILSNDPTVVSFVRFVANAITTIDNLIANLSTVHADDDEETQDQA